MCISWIIQWLISLMHGYNHGVQTKADKNFQTGTEVTSTLWLRFFALCVWNKPEVIQICPQEERSPSCQRSWLPGWNQHADWPQAGGLLCSPVLILRRTGTGPRQSGLPWDFGQRNSSGPSQGSLSSGTSLSCVCISKYPQPQPSLVPVSASIQSPHSVLFVSASIHNPKPHLCPYQQVTCPSTLSCLYQQVSPDPTDICISKYPEPPHPSFSVSASIHSPNRHLYLYQHVSSVSTRKLFCISKYPQAQPSFLSVLASIHNPNPQCVCITQYPQTQTSLCLYHPVSAAANLIVFVSAGISSLHLQHARGARPEQRPTPVSLRGRAGPEDRAKQWQRVLLQQLPGAVSPGEYGQSVPVRSVLLPHRWVTFREPEGTHRNQILLWDWSPPEVQDFCDVTFGVTCQQT